MYVLHQHKYSAITSANLNFIAVIVTINYTITHFKCGYALIVCAQKGMTRANVTYMLYMIDYELAIFI